jgi:uncharacterized membrane protein
VLRRWLRRATGQAPFLLVVALLVVAFVYLVFAPGHWRRGAAVIALSALVAGLLRIGLPAHRAGLLRVRARWIDVVCYLGLGGLILSVAIRLG